MDMHNDSIQNQRCIDFRCELPLDEASWLHVGFVRFSTWRVFDVDMCCASFHLDPEGLGFS